MAMAEGGSVSSRAGYGRGVPSPADYGVWGNVVSSPSGILGKAPAENGFLAYFEGHRTLFFVLI